MTELTVDKIRFDERGLVPVIVQDYNNYKVLMQAYADKEAIDLTLKTGLAHFWSRSRKKLWLKGETSGNVQKVRKVLIDCDEDSIIYLVESKGPACHTGNRSCFYRNISGSERYDEILQEIRDYYIKAPIISKKWVRDNTKDEYKYILNPITENYPPPSPQVMAWLANVIDEMTPMDIDKVVVPESFGIPIATLVSERKGKPLAIVRKRNFGSDPEGKVDYASGYEVGQYYIYGVASGDRVLLIDDAISTGGTIDSLMGYFIKNNIDVADISCSMSKDMYGGRKLILDKYGIRVKSPVVLNFDSEEKLTVKFEFPGESRWLK
ncbi:MAG: phosphoribosyl-AMP cyclohydrolase [Conexivisphaerales archaeon]